MPLYRHGATAGQPGWYILELSVKRVDWGCQDQSGLRGFIWHGKQCTNKELGLDVPGCDTRRCLKALKRLQSLVVSYELPNDILGSSSPRKSPTVTSSFHLSSTTMARRAIDRNSSKPIKKGSSKKTTSLRQHDDQAYATSIS